MNITLKQPLTNVQLELLKMFSYQLSDNDIADLKKNLALFFSKKLVDEADKNWINKGFNDNDMQKLLVTKLRKSK